MLTQSSGNPTILVSTNLNAPGWRNISRQTMLVACVSKLSSSRFIQPKARCKVGSRWIRATRSPNVLGAVVTISVSAEAANAMLPYQGTLGGAIGTIRSTSSLNRLGATRRNECQNCDHCSSVIRMLSARSFSKGVKPVKDAKRRRYYVDNVIELL